MKIAVISDIHGNYEALDSVLKDIDAQGVDERYCLGDIVGYGPQPEECVQRIIKEGIPTTIGNHDLAVVEDQDMSRWRYVAKKSIEITKGMLSEESLNYIKKLPSNITTKDFLFVHGVPPDSWEKYIDYVEEYELVRILSDIEQNVVFVGHTHLINLRSSDGLRIIKNPLFEGETTLSRNYKHVINIGSVGQPRDGNSSAKYVIFDQKKYSVELRCIEYDIQKTCDLIMASDFPVDNAERLKHGF